MSKQQGRTRAGRAWRTRRSLGTLESLEPRLLMAADVFEAVLDDPSVIAAHARPSRASGDAGETFATAYDLGEINGSQQYPGWAGWRDRRDVMRFSIASKSEVDIALTELTADLDLYLYDSQGRRVAQSDNGGSRSDSIHATLGEGTFYAVVAPWRWAASSYKLSFDAAAVSPPIVAPPPAVRTPLSLATGRLVDVPYFGGAIDWNLNAIDAPESWAAGFTGSGVTIAIVDTGIDLDHPDLIDNIWVNPGEIAGNGIDDDQNGYVDDVQGWDFVSNDNRPDDRNGHGTHVAGTIAAAANGFGATGVSPDATIMPVRVLGNNGSGSSLTVAAGIRYAAENGADIINLSLGGGFSSSIWSAIEYADQLGSLVVAAAGNESAGAPGYPARFSSQLSNVISVGAYSAADQTAAFSNRAGTSGAVQVDAPGVGIFSTYLDGRYATFSGTSMAAPHVAGLAALALSANPQLTAAQLRGLIADGAERTIAGSDSAGGISSSVTVALAAASLGTQSSFASAPSVSGSQGRPVFAASFTHIRSRSELSSVADLPNSIGDPGRGIPAHPFAADNPRPSLSSLDLRPSPIQRPWSEQVDSVIAELPSGRSHRVGMANLRDVVNWTTVADEALAELFQIQIT